jgi:hypothetical protein
MTNLKINLIIVLVLLMLCINCSNDDSSDVVPDEPGSGVPFQELYDQGIDKYLGKIVPVSTESMAGGVTEYVFSNEDGPVCYTGNEYSMFTRDGSSDNLLIFMQGGGFCSPIVCEAVEEGIPLIPFGILNPLDSQSPTFGYNLGYLPYCDGSLWMGDGEADSDGDGMNDRFFKGLQNLSASLDVVVQTYPSPDKIVLAGNSAGGYGVHAALPLVRKLYPEVRIYLINDSGIGIFNPGGFEGLGDYWNADAFIPASCTDCIGVDGNLTGYHQYQLAEDEYLQMAYISAKQDSTASAAIGGAAFEAQLLEGASELNAAFPDRFQSLIMNGDAHTFIIRTFDYQVSDFTVKQWVGWMINEGEDWDSFTE